MTVSAPGYTPVADVLTLPCQRHNCLRLGTRVALFLRLGSFSALEKAVCVGKGPKGGSENQLPRQGTLAWTASGQQLSGQTTATDPGQ